MGKWAIIREEFPLAGLANLGECTGGASAQWVFVEPSIAEVHAANAKEGAEQIETLITEGVRDPAGARVFGEEEGTRFSDLPARAGGELLAFAMRKLLPEQEDAEGGKP